MSRLKQVAGASVAGVVAGLATLALSSGAVASDGERLGPPPKVPQLFDENGNLNEAELAKTLIRDKDGRLRPTRPADLTPPAFSPEEVQRMTPEERKAHGIEVR